MNTIHANKDVPTERNINQDSLKLSVSFLVMNPIPAHRTMMITLKERGTRNQTVDLRQYSSTYFLKMLGIVKTASDVATVSDTITRDNYLEKLPKCEGWWCNINNRLVILLLSAIIDLVCFCPDNCCIFW